MVYLKKFHHSSPNLNQTYYHLRTWCKTPTVFFRPEYNKLIFEKKYLTLMDIQRKLEIIRNVQYYYFGTFGWSSTETKYALLSSLSFSTYSSSKFWTNWNLFTLKAQISSYSHHRESAILHRSSSWKVKWRRSSQVPLAPIEAFKAKPVCLEHHWATLSVTGLGLSSLETNRWVKMLGNVGLLSLFGGW